MTNSLQIYSSTVWLNSCIGDISGTPGATGIMEVCSVAGLAPDAFPERRGCSKASGTNARTPRRLILHLCPVTEAFS